VVTSHGKPVAKISPFDANEEVRAATRETLLARLRSQPVMKAQRWTRDELYEEEQ